MTSPSEVPLEAITVLSSEHGRERRLQRNIAIKDLQAAIKYGKKIPGFKRPDGRETWMYTHAGITYVTDSTSKKEITSWAAQGC
eukprot:CAMPEP_0194385646 /NCGR_PEP_ID=MMETSP0174-20130528/81473_1 /TAXON_ID=216777 /ORGANISM="Proboscia alata, Strain PI-D3" /LENGTH=83 /DNA_ID=CAMNT_0039173971 /DNA_START=15 /DNA_END=263 /DNA_ORIENTATION=+